MATGTVGLLIYTLYSTGLFVLVEATLGCVETLLQGCELALLCLLLLHLQFRAGIVYVSK